MGKVNDDCDDYYFSIIGNWRPQSMYYLFIAVYYTPTTNKFYNQASTLQFQQVEQLPTSY
jgi:hypothetical protein